MERSQRQGLHCWESKAGRFYPALVRIFSASSCFTRNDGTDQNGFSRITDGSADTYWKSNPYLSKAFTGEDDSKYPQWVVVDLATSHPINAIRIAWGEPFARHYLVQYWTGEDPIKQPTKGAGLTFPGGAIADGFGGTKTLQLKSSPLLVRYLRIWMTESSNTCDSHGSAGRRDCGGTVSLRSVFW